MKTEQLDTALALEQMQNGDCLAFSGKGVFSDVIRWITRSNVSHVGAVYRAAMPGPLMVAESTTLNENGNQGVDIVTLAARLAHYDGAIWWVPLSKPARLALHEAEWLRYMGTQKSKKYGKIQAVLAGLGIPQPGINKRLFCSEYMGFGYEAGGLCELTSWVDNPSTITPEELLRLTMTGGAPLFERAYQISGTFAEIRLRK